MRQRVREVLAERLEIRVPEGAQLLKSVEVRHFLRVSDDTLKNWRKSGKGPPFLKLSRGTVRYPIRSFRRYLRQHLERAISASSDRSLLSEGQK